MDRNSFTAEQKQMHQLRHYPKHPHIGVGGIILWENHVLIIKRKFNPNQGLWAIPGGHLKLGESAATGALRECIEETGLPLKVGKIASVIDKIDYDSDGKLEYHYVLCDYWIDLVSDYTLENPPIPIPQSDVLDARFVAYVDLPSFKLTKTVKLLFQEIGIYPQ